MTERSDYFSRIADRVDLGLLTQKFVVMLGVGSVGSIMALELARCGVGHMVLVDGDRLEPQNLSRHALPEHYVGANKAEAMASHLALNVPGLDVGGAAHNIDDSFSDTEIDRFLVPADLVVVATDRRRSQRRLARRALAMDIPAVVPGLYADRGGEVFTQLTPGEACFTCWDDFRDPDAEVRGATSVNADALGVIQQAVYLCLALLDPHSRHARDLARGQDDPRPRQLFQLHPGAALLRSTVTRRLGCVGCAVGPSPLSGGDHHVADATRTAGRVRDGHTRSSAAGWPLVLTGASTPPVLHSLHVSDQVVLEGATVTLSWAVENASRVTIERFGDHPSVGSLEAAITQTTAFRLNAVNPFGQISALSPSVITVQLPRLREVPIPSPPATWHPIAATRETRHVPALASDVRQVPDGLRSQASVLEAAPRSARASAFASSPAVRTVLGWSAVVPMPRMAPVTFAPPASVNSLKRAILRRDRRQS
jgi:molybdopterin/thiamine biosynthesis adenylyltransferase